MGVLPWGSRAPALSGNGRAGPAHPRSLSHGHQVTRDHLRRIGSGGGIPVTKKGSKQKGYSGHGLRKASATIAAESGATEAELNAMFGWTGHQMAQLYTKRADRQRLAARAMAKWARPSSDYVVGKAELTHLMLEKERG